jgi:methyltransferase (TIGR00027 family)
MQSEPSRTAMLAAAARAGHILSHGPRVVLNDWLAWPLLGSDAETYLERGVTLLGEYAVDYATWHAARTRLPEDWVAASAAEQYVLLGAGLDSFAWRQTGAIPVYEFDHPATQRWKRTRLEKLLRLGLLPWPPTLTMVEADFERQSLQAILETSPLDLHRPLFVSWIGVLTYLTPDAITAALSALPPCSAAISYVLPEARWDARTRTFAEPMMRALAELGEPLLTLTTPEETAALIETGGFRVVEDIGADDVTARFGLPCVSHERIVLAHKGS